MSCRPPGLADEPKFGQPLDHSTGKRRTLLGEHNNFRVFQSLSELRCIFFGVRVYNDLMSVQFRIALKRFECVLIIINNYDFHQSSLLVEFLSCSSSLVVVLYTLRSLRLVLNFLALFQFGYIVAQSRFELVLRRESQLRPCPRDIHARTRGSQFPTGDPDSRKYFSQRFFESATVVSVPLPRL